MEKINWLQISDLHIRDGNSSKWQLMKDNCLKYLKNENIRFIIITGDLHQYKNDYGESLTFLNELSKELSIDKKYIYILPGNHDLNTKKTNMDIMSSIIYNTEKDEDFYFERKDKLKQNYKEYKKFLIDFYGENVDSFIKVLDGVSVFSVDDLINIILVNSTFVSDGKHDHNEIIPTKELTELSIGNINPSIICMHYHPDDLFESHRRILNSVVKNNSLSALLCGHRHISNFEDNKNNYINNFNCPIIGSPKFAYENYDNYSDIGFIMHQWDVEQSKVDCKYYHWIDDGSSAGRFDEDQRLKPDINKYYSYFMNKACENTKIIDNKYKLFISHSSKDSILTYKIIRLLKDGMSLNEDNIFCTSLDGMLHQGDNFISEIEKNVVKCEAAIFVMTKSYISSPFCMTEMGVIWALNKSIIPLVADSETLEKLSETPITVEQCFRLYNECDLKKLGKKLASKKIGTFKQSKFNK